MTQRPTEKLERHPQTPPTKRKTKPRQIVDNAFVEMVKNYRDALGWKNSKLASEAGISKAQISSWFGEESTTNRVLGRAHVNRIAVALARGFDENKNYVNGLDELDRLLNELL